MTSGPLPVRPVRLLLAAVLALAVLPPAAAGDPGGFRLQRDGAGDRPQRPPRPPQDGGAWAPRRDEAPPPPQRLTPDERRQLRRDVHDAGRDLYPPRRDPRR